jgi:hypothetical protein
MQFDDVGRGRSYSIPLLAPVATAIQRWLDAFVRNSLLIDSGACTDRLSCSRTKDSRGSKGTTL